MKTAIRLKLLCLLLFYSLCLYAKNTFAQDLQAEHAAYASQTVTFSPLRTYQEHCPHQSSFQDKRLDPLKVLFLPHSLPILFCQQSDHSDDPELKQNLLFLWTPSDPGGNSHGERWELRVPHTEVKHLNLQKYPFLKCEGFQAHRYCAWDFKVHQSPDMLTLSASNIAQPCRVEQSWQDILDEIASQFKTCHQMVRF